MAEKRKRILSGVQPSGKLHLGNYFGAIKQHIALQDQGECFYFIADYHADDADDAVRADAEAAKKPKRKPRPRRNPPRQRPRRGPRLPGPRPRPDEGHLLPPVRRARK